MKPPSIVRLEVDFVVSEVRRLLRGGGVALTSLLVYSSLYAILAEMSTLAAVVISIIAYTTAMSVSFVGHKYITFGSIGDTKTQILKFLALQGVCLLATVLITSLVVNVMRWPYGLAILLVDIFIPAISYLALKLVVFADKPAAPALPTARESKGVWH
jgi:putative flippase GtrA